MAEYTKEEALAFIDAMRHAIGGKVGFKWLVERLSDLTAYIESTSAENELLKRRIDLAEDTASEQRRDDGTTITHDQLTTMLMFTGRAEEAIDFYTGLFDGSSIESIERYGSDYPGPEGQVVHARFALNGSHFMAMDSAVEQPFTFTPSISIFVTCPDASEVDRLYAALADGGDVRMELDTYPFATRYAWVEDRFGVSWQLVFA